MVCLFSHGGHLRDIYNCKIIAIILIKKHKHPVQFVQKEVNYKNNRIFAT